MKVWISQPNGKEHLVQAFKDAGVEILTYKGSYVKPDLIIPVVDEELPSFSYLRHELPVMCASAWTIDTCRDKAEFYRFCRRMDFKTPYTMQDKMIVKPRYGKGSKGIVRLDKSFLVQEDLSSHPEISIDYFADWEGNTLSVIPRYRMSVVNGESTEVKFINDLDLTEVTRLGKSLQLIGHNVIQGFLRPDGIVFTEVNPRFGGGSWMTFEKFNSPRWLMEHIGERVCH